MNGSESTGLKLLIADDEPWIHENLRSMLADIRMGFDVLEPAGDGEKALRKIKAHRPDILITDINMPFMNGNDLIREARILDPGLQIIVLSGYDDFRFVRDALLSGAVDYLIKPVKRHILLDVLETAVTNISENHKEEEERARIRKKLLEATSILKDGELSAYIRAEGPTPMPRIVTEMDLQFPMYALVLINVLDLQRISRRLELSVPQLCLELKKTVEGGLPPGNHLLFNNIYARSEFVLVTDHPVSKSDELRHRLPDILKRTFGCRVRMAFGKTRFSLGELNTAYAEARLALSVRKLGDDDFIVSAEASESAEIRKRIAPEQEKQLQVALRSGNKAMVREVIFDRIGIRGCDEAGWLLIEIRKSVEFIAGALFHYGENDLGMLLSAETYGYLLDSALDSENIPEVCGIFEQILEELFAEASPYTGGDSMKQTIRSVRQYVEENYFQDISLSSLADRFGVDRSYLCRTFKQVTGSNLMQTIAQKRIDKAREYIRRSVAAGGDDASGELSLAEISDLVGYEEYAYFNRVFRKLTGSNPSDYRSALMKEAGK